MPQYGKLKIDQFLYNDSGTDVTLDLANIASRGANTFTGNQSLGDNIKAQFGASNDLQIYHNGSHSFISDLGTGDLRLTGSTIKILDSAQSENILEATENGAVKLYYDNSKKLNTESWGVDINGKLRADEIQVTDTHKIRLGTGNDLEIYHDSNGNSQIYNNTGFLIFNADAGNIDFRFNSGNEHSVDMNRDGAVELYYDNSKKFNTTSAGVQLTGSLAFMSESTNISILDNGKAKFGNSDDLQIYHDGTDSKILNNTGNLIIGSAGEHGVKCTANGTTQLYFDNAGKLQTTFDGVWVTGDYRGGDNSKLRLGDSNDLQIFHDGTNSMIDNNAGELKISTPGVLRLRGGNVSIQNENQTETMAFFSVNSNAKLYFDNVEKLETANAGIIVDGYVSALGNNGYAYITNDNLKSAWGTGLDLNLYHDGSDSYIENTTGHLFLMANNSDKAIKVTPNQQVDFYYDNSRKCFTTSWGFQVSGHCIPHNDNTHDLGASNERWKYIYSNNSLNTSDRNLKNTIKVSDLGLSFVNKLNPVSYKFNDGADNRTHYGLIAQELEETIKTEGKTLDDFAGIVESKGIYNLAYSELISPLIKAVQELTTEVETLKTKVEALKAE